VLNAECALFALEHEGVFAQQAATIRAEREVLFNALQQLPHVTPYKSDANMLLVRFDGAPDAAQRVFDALKAHKVLVKNVSKMHPLLANCLRLTVGTPEENKQLLSALRSTERQP
jgi:histidinol-phosphate aminotransferase